MPNMLNQVYVLRNNPRTLVDPRRSSGNQTEIPVIRLPDIASRRDTGTDSKQVPSEER